MEKMVFVAAGEDHKKENEKDLLIILLCFLGLCTISVTQTEIIY